MDVLDTPRDDPDSIQKQERQAAGLIEGAHTINVGSGESLSHTLINICKNNFVCPHITQEKLYHGIVN